METFILGVWRVMKWGEITYSKTTEADMKPDNQVAR